MITKFQLYESTEVINGYMNIKKYVVWRMKFYLIILEVLWCDTHEAKMKSRSQQQT